MKIHLVTAFIVVMLCLTTTTAFAQKRRTSAPSPLQATRNTPAIDALTGNTILCKGLPLPEGFSVSGEMFADSCNGAAWILKPKAESSSAPKQLDNRMGPSTSAAFGEPNEAIAPGQCDTFQQTIKRTFNFDPARFTDAQREAKSVELDQFWNMVRQSRGTLVPCLRKALKEDNSGSFFAIDGSMLLVEVDPSNASKALQVNEFTEANLDGTDLEYWVKTMARRGVEGFDTSRAAAKWLLYPNAKYTLSMHGGYPIDSFLGALFIFGSMPEDLATPTLIRIANDVSHPHRNDAVGILATQATPAAYRAFKELNVDGLSAGARQVVREILESPKLLKPRSNPKLTREENLRAFQGIIDGDYSAFREMVLKAPDGEVDAVATLRPEDIPLLRRARRASISRCNQHAVSDYLSFTQILLALTWKPELVK